MDFVLISSVALSALPLCVRASGRDQPLSLLMLVRLGEKPAPMLGLAPPAAAAGRHGNIG